MELATALSRSEEARPQSRIPGVYSFAHICAVVSLAAPRVLDDSVGRPVSSSMMPNISECNTSSCEDFVFWCGVGVRLVEREVPG